MTRINVGIDVKTLTDKHLLAEHREIKRIPNAVRSGKAIIKDIPTTFRLGSGHVKFFYNRLGYLLERYREIHAECIRRGFAVQDFSNAWHGISSDLMGNYIPSNIDTSLVKQRILERLK